MSMVIYSECRCRELRFNEAAVSKYFPQKCSRASAVIREITLKDKDSANA
jgi:hypothetical protein